jgi:hypothetical protein
MHIVLSHTYNEVFQFTKQFHPTYLGVKNNSEDPVEPIDDSR